MQFNIVLAEKEIKLLKFLDFAFPEQFSPPENPAKV